MTFLKKLGLALAQGVSIAVGLGPLVIPFLGSGKAAHIASTTINDLTQVAQIVAGTEALIQGSGNGATKLAAATPLVLQILRSSQAFDGKKIQNETLAEQGASKIVSGIADFMNAIHSDEIKTS